MIKSNTKLIDISTPNNPYFRYLCHVAGIDDYTLLAKTLYKLEFKWFIPNDDNRIVDGHMFREEFEDETRIVIGKYPKAITLEVMVGIARRFSELADISIQTAFRELLLNSGLYAFTDDEFYENGGPKTIKRIMNDIIFRHYSSTGSGSFFPLSKPNGIDMRITEIWYQMQYYLEQNYL